MMVVVVFAYLTLFGAMSEGVVVSGVAGAPVKIFD